MKRQRLAIAFAVLLLAAFSTTAMAARAGEDTDTRMINAKVVEVNDQHISVVAQSGVEHVIAIDDAGTKVKVEGKLVSLKNLHEGDIVTIELDALSPQKFAKNIVVSLQANSQLATTRP